jgi:hypothetical protein
MRRVCAVVAAACAVLLLASHSGGPRRRDLYFWQRRGEDGRTEVPDLLYFRGESDMYSQQMAPLNNQLRKEGHKIRTFEVWFNARNTELLQNLDYGRCGGVPFYFNKRTRKYICGATTMDNLRRWAEDRKSDPNLPPPDLVKHEPEKQESPLVDQLKDIKKSSPKLWKDLKCTMSKFRDGIEKGKDQVKQKYEDFRGANEEK